MKSRAALFIVLFMCGFVHHCAASGHIFPVLSYSDVAVIVFRVFLALSTVILNLVSLIRGAVSKSRNISRMLYICLFANCCWALFFLKVGGNDPDGFDPTSLNIILGLIAISCVDFILVRQIQRR